MHGSAALTRRTAQLVAVVVVASFGTGCNRHHFRNRADKDVTGVLTEKNVFPDWKIENWHVYPDPAARYADHSCPDHPPYPPDDFAARFFGPNPQRVSKRAGAGRVDGTGYVALLERWDAQNRAAEPLPMPKPKEKPEKPTPAGPTVSEVRDPTVVVIAGEVDDGTGKTIPAVVVIPAGGQPPERLPDPTPLPKKDSEPSPYPGGTMAVVATGDAAVDFLKALTDGQAGYRIKLEQSVELGVLNSREFQDRREDLYLAALPVTTERFSFAAQGFFTEQVIRENTGRERPEGAGERLRINTNTGFSKLFPTGALLLVQLANQFVIDLTGDRPYTSVSNLSLSVAQPLLRGGGYAVTLENLTQAERNLLYGIRSYARFRRLFYVSIAAGGQITNNPYGLQGLSTNLGRGIGGNLTAPVAGYLPLLLQSAIIANQRRNIESLEELLKLYQAFREGGQQSDLQVGQVEQQLLNGRTQLLGRATGGAGGGGIRGYLDTIDNFKLQLGLPATVQLDLDNSPLKPVRDQLGRFEKVYAQVRDVELAAGRYDPNEPVTAFRPRWKQLLTRSPLVEGTAFSKSIAQRWAVWEKLTDDQLNRWLADITIDRQKALDRRTDRQAKGQPEPEVETRKLVALEAELDLGRFEKALRAYEARPWAKLTQPSAGIFQAGAFRDVFNSFYQLILEGRNDRLTSLRQRWPKLPPVVVDGVDLLAAPLDDAYTVGIQTALSNRLDLMNARGQVVDAWRQIAVRANSLQGVFDVRYDLLTSSPAGQADPLAFGGSRTRNQVTFRAELPIVRRVERNNYRAALIGYQRQRRTLMAFEDNIATDVRGDVRELRTLAELYRFQQRLIELGYSQVDNAQAILLAPPPPGSQADAGNAAALTLQVLQAQSSLLDAQNTLYTIWVSYLTSRLTLYLDLERLSLDSRGVWSDELVPGADGDDRRPDRGPADAAARPPVGERLPPPRRAGDPGGDR